MQVVHQHHQHIQQQQFSLLYPWCTLHGANNLIPNTTLDFD
jgi:hypothetical protein